MATRKNILVFLIVLLVSMIGIQTARADGIIYPDLPVCPIDGCPPPPCPGPWHCPPMPPSVQLAIRYHRVDVKIENQIAVTRVDQVFYNPNDYVVEGTYIFPLPKDATVSAFTLWQDDAPLQGEILPADQARKMYEQIVQSQRDPALLEYIDRGAVQARIFPIEPRSERRIELEYSQVLSAEGGLVRYVYPLSTEKYSLWPLEDVVIKVDIRSRLPLRAVYSPSHPVSIQREEERHVTAGYEEKNVRPDKDFSLYYSIGESEALHLLSYRDPQDAYDPDGYFLVLLAPKPEAEDEIRPVAKDVLLVLDRSGSMEGEKFRQAQDAMRYVLEHLNPDDRYNLIAFSTGVDVYAPQLQPADDIKGAISWVDRLSAQGSTDINRALLEAVALVDRERPTYLIFLTDGLPTEGVVDNQQILDNFNQNARRNIRLFAFGVGYDVDTHLLDSLASENRGASFYVLPGDPLDETLSSFYARISTPVLTQLSLDYGDMRVYDVYPAQIPDLFIGSQIIITGRYRGSGATTITLRGDMDGREQSFRFPEQVFDSGEYIVQDATLQTLPRLWATRKIGHLLSQVRLKGADQETIEQIVQLSIRFGIVTPYTSYLVTEELPLGSAQQDRIAAEQYSQMSEMPAEPAFGQSAVEKAMGMGGMADASAPVANPEDTQTRVKVIGARTFILSNGVWMDTGYDPDVMIPTRVSFLSEDYFNLLASDPALGAAFALGERVIAISGGKIFEVVDSGSTVAPLNLPENNVSSPATGQPEETITPALNDFDPPKKHTPCAGGLIPLLLVCLPYWFKRQKVD